MADAADGLGPRVTLKALLFMAFGLRFLSSHTNHDCQAMGVYTAFLVTPLTEMRGIPLAGYLLGSRLGSRFPLLHDTHAGGHM
jgi:hypothetical protein